MSDNYVDPAGESELRRRAAWFLGMLVVVAALLVTLMVYFLNSGGGNNKAAPPPPLPTAPGLTLSHSGGAPTSSSTSPSASSSVTEPPTARQTQVNCPDQSPCIAHGDIGNAVAAINQYRQQHGQPAVNGIVSAAAQTCAVTNGDQCSGSWAESQVPSADGNLAVQKILPYAQLLDPNLSALQVGWAYDPASEQYYFAVVREDS